MATGLVTFTYDETKPGPYNVVIGTFDSDISNNAVGTCKPISGEVVRVVTDPGSPAPLDDWDLVITDNHGIDITVNSSASLLNRDTANTEQQCLVMDSLEAAAGIFPVVNGALTFTLSNCGKGKVGVIYVYWKAEDR
jgi:hypothetical protein